MLFPYTKKQKQEFLKRFGYPIKINGEDELGIVERDITNTDGEVSETLYVTIDAQYKQDDKVTIDDIQYRIAYIVNDGSGLVDAYLSFISEAGRISKYD
ncbi:hypothetical protein ACLH2J_01875 [Klebsiella michiganensis]|uniref:hypothetical protein n=1 Tax=Klebsiella TaxID=570 RepID=UPI0027DF736A|nr:hypothetical protein [Klebsiella quasipneumoniae]MDQ6443023.1 hypothetical protein [Klebsiella quasipneumoniae]